MSRVQQAARLFHRASACRPLLRQRVPPAAGVGVRGLAAKSKKGEADPSKPSLLALALKQVEASHGKGSIMQLGKARPMSDVDVISTGSLSLNHALGIGGLPKGRIVEVYGPESSGKTTVALHAVAQCQQNGGTAVFVDAEHALDPAYAAAIGVDMNALYVSQPDCGEQALDIVETLVRSGGVDIVVVDSVAALVPRAELEGEMGDHHIALQARLMSQALRKLTATLSKTNTCIVFINQIRSKVGVIFGSNEVTAGGNALRFYCSVRLEVRRGAQIKRDGEPIGNVCRVKVAKNKLAAPFQTAEFDMLYGAGVDRNGELIDLGVKCGAVRKSGAWFSLGDVPDWRADGAAHEAGALLGQGREKAKALLAEQPHLAAALEKVIHSRLAHGSVSLASAGMGVDAAGDELQVEDLGPELELELEEQLKETAV